MFVRFSRNRLFLLSTERLMNVVVCDFDRKKDMATVRKVGLLAPMSREQFALSSVEQAAVKKVSRTRDGRYRPVLLLKTGRSIHLMSRAKRKAMGIAKEIQGFLEI